MKKDARDGRALLTALQHPPVCMCVHVCACVCVRACVFVYEALTTNTQSRWKMC